MRSTFVIHVKIKHFCNIKMLFKLLNAFKHFKSKIKWEKNALEYLRAILNATQIILFQYCKAENILSRTEEIFLLLK